MDLWVMSRDTLYLRKLFLQSNFLVRLIKTIFSKRECKLWGVSEGLVDIARWKWEGCGFDSGELVVKKWMDALTDRNIGWKGKVLRQLSKFRMEGNEDSFYWQEIANVGRPDRNWSACEGGMRNSLGHRSWYVLNNWRGGRLSTVWLLMWHSEVERLRLSAYITLGLLA